jgi:hypothetical protein
MKDKHDCSGDANIYLNGGIKSIAYLAIEAKEGWKNTNPALYYALLDINELNKSLDEHVGAEEYERAAMVRDEINKRLLA